MTRAERTRLARHLLETTPPDVLSCVLNAHHGGSVEEPFSVRCYRLQWKSLKWFALRWIVDSHYRRHTGEERHCQKHFLAETAADDIVGDVPRLDAITDVQNQVV